MACEAGQLQAGARGQARGRCCGPMAAARPRPEPTEPTAHSPGLDTLKLWCSLFLSV